MLQTRDAGRNASTVGRQVGGDVDTEAAVNALDSGGGGDGKFTTIIII